MEIATTEAILEKTGYNVGEYAKENEYPWKELMVVSKLKIDGDYTINQLVAINDIHLPMYYMNTLFYGNNITYRVNDSEILNPITVLRNLRLDKPELEIEIYGWTPDKGAMLIQITSFPNADFSDGESLVLYTGGSDEYFTIDTTSTPPNLVVSLNKKINTPQFHSVSVIAIKSNIKIDLLIKAYL